MKLFITIEAENSAESGLSEIFLDTRRRLSSLIDKETDSYGDEFRLIAVIPTCISDFMWNNLGWKERKLFWRKKKEAEIRLKMDYQRFVNESSENKRLMFISIIVKSILMVQENSKGNFKGYELIADILEKFNVTKEQLKPFD